jgi:hypothetical protein
MPQAARSWSTTYSAITRRAGRVGGGPSKLRPTLGESRADGEVAEWLKALAC